MKLKLKNGGIVKARGGRKVYNHNDYYGYINKIQEKAISNPQWFWSDAADASEARQWLYNNGASAIVDNIYENTPEDIQKTISYKKLSNTSGNKKMTSGIHDAQNSVLDTAGAIGLQSAGMLAGGIGIALAPEVTIPAIIGGVAGAKATDSVTNKLSKGKYNTWGEFVRGNSDWGQTGNLLAEFTNPGALIGGSGAAALARRSTPMMIKAMQDQIWELNRDGSFKYDVPGGAKARLNSAEPVKWTWSKSKDAGYDNGVIKTPLFARKSQIAHEVGHHAAGQGDQILGAYTEGYQYAPNSSWETERAENFADLFKTRLGYKYKGKNANLKARQEAIDSGESKVFDHLANPGNHRETAIDRWNRIDDPTTDEYGIYEYLNDISSTGYDSFGDTYAHPGIITINPVSTDVGIPSYNVEYNTQFRPESYSFMDIANELSKVFGKKVNFADISSPEKVRRIQKVLQEHPFVKEFGSTVDPDTTESTFLPMPFDLGHLFWLNNSGKSGAQQFRTLMNNAKGIRLTEINTSADSEPMKAFIGNVLNGKEPGQVTVIPAKMLDESTGRLIQSRSEGNAMHHNILEYDPINRRYTWGGKKQRSFKAPLREDTYLEAIQKYADDITGPWNKHIERINEKQNLDLKPVTLGSHMSFDGFNIFGLKTNPHFERDDFFLQFHKKGGKFKNPLCK